MSYPPFFYLLEAGLFAVLGPSPYLAKGIVLSFTLVEAIYAMVWLRRWVAEEAGYSSAVVLLLPGMVEWSHAIMLNVPACAMTLAALYHTKRWLEEPGSRHFYAAACLSTLTVLTYFPAAVVVPIIVAWVVAAGHSRLLIVPRTLATAAVCGIVLLPCFVLALRWARLHVEMTAATPGLISKSTTWLYYLNSAQSLFGQAMPALAALGVITGIVSRCWRFETMMLSIWVVLAYVFLTYLRAKDERYLLPFERIRSCSWAPSGWLR